MKTKWKSKWTSPSTEVKVKIVSSLGASSARQHMHCVFQIFSTYNIYIYIHLYTHICHKWVHIYWEYLGFHRWDSSACAMRDICGKFDSSLFLWQIGIVFESLRQVLMGKCVYRALYKTAKEINSNYNNSNKNNFNINCLKWLAAIIGVDVA